MSEHEPWQRRVRRPGVGFDTPVPDLSGETNEGQRASSSDGSAASEQPLRRRPRDEWRPAASFGLVVGIAVTIALVVIGVIGVAQAVDASDGNRMLWALVAVIGLACAVGA